jgi:hypothetical protein
MTTARRAVPMAVVQIRRLQKQQQQANASESLLRKMRRPRFSRRSGLVSSPQLLLPLLLLLVQQFWSSSIHFVAVVSAEKDSNPYPWGENPNNQFKMYWNNAPNVVQDLDKFSALYIKFHGCVWSECSLGDAYDDDGENRDGGTYIPYIERE